MKLSEFNQLSDSEREEKLLQICHSSNWAKKVSGQAPFASFHSLSMTMTAAWIDISNDDLLEAISAHPRIGDIKVLKDKFSGQAGREQGQVAQASEELISDLYALNEQYFNKFGFIFLICASGKSAEYMRDALKQRLPNPKHVELENAAREQEKISQIRLRHLIDEGPQA